MSDENEVQAPDGAVQATVTVPVVAPVAEASIVAPVAQHPAVAAIARIEANLGPMSANQGGLLEWLKHELAALKRLF